MNKEGGILTLVKGRIGREQKAIVTDQAQHKGGRSKSAKAKAKAPPPPADF
jgi:hypothetical protein